MGQDITAQDRAQQVTWETLEEYVRGRAQSFVQEPLEEELTELLARGKSERRAVVDAGVGYRNGYGKPRRLTLGSGAITVRRPRVRGLEERFESRFRRLNAPELVKEVFEGAVHINGVRASNQPEGLAA